MATSDRVPDDDLETIQARRAVASLAGLWLRRLQEEDSPDPTAMMMRRVWGEALQQFSDNEEDEEDV